MFPRLICKEYEETIILTEHRDHFPYPSVPSLILCYIAESNREEREPGMYEYPMTLTPLASVMEVTQDKILPV